MTKPGPRSLPRLALALLMALSATALPASAAPDIPAPGVNVEFTAVGNLTATGGSTTRSTWSYGLYVTPSGAVFIPLPECSGAWRAGGSGKAVGAAMRASGTSPFNYDCNLSNLSEQLQGRHQGSGSVTWTGNRLRVTARHTYTAAASGTANAARGSGRVEAVVELTGSTCRVRAFNIQGNDVRRAGPMGASDTSEHFESLSGSCRVSTGRPFFE